MTLKKYCNKKLLASLLIAAMAFGGGYFAYGKTSNSQIVSLNTQEEEINNSIAITSVENVENFDSKKWISSTKILGISTTKDKKQQICVYDSENNSFVELYTAGDKEIILIDDFINTNSIIFSELKDGNLKNNHYRLKILNLNDKSIIELSDDMSAECRNSNNEFIIAEGFNKNIKMYRVDMNGTRQEIILSNELVSKLNDFSKFSFDDYLNTFYIKEKEEIKSEEGNDRFKKIKSHYDNDVLNNSIEWLDIIDDNELFLMSKNRIGYTFNTQTLTVKEGKKNYKESSATKNNNSSVTISYGKNNVDTLYKLSVNGEKENVIDKGRIFGLKISPNNKKISYIKKSRDGNKHQFVYDLDQNKGVEIFSTVFGRIEWNESSNSFFISGINTENPSKEIKSTSIIKLSK